MWIRPIWHCKAFPIWLRNAYSRTWLCEPWIPTRYGQYMLGILYSRVRIACEGLLKCFNFACMLHAACMFAMDAYLPLLCSLGSWRLQRPGRLGRVLDFCWALACFQRLWPRWAEGTPALPHSGGHACSTYSGSFGLVLDAARCFLLFLCATKTWVASWRRMVSRTALASVHAIDIITRKHEKAKPLFAEAIEFGTV